MELNEVEEQVGGDYKHTNNGVTTGSLTVSTRRMMLVPPRRFSRILISRLIFFFLTGCGLKRRTFHENVRNGK